MMNFSKLVSAAAIAIGATTVSAQTVCPPDAAATARQFGLTTSDGVTSTTSTCLAWGDGNLQGSNNDAFTSVFSDYVYIDKDPNAAAPILRDENWFEATGNMFFINPFAWDVYSQIAFGVKVGDNSSPDWAVWLLDAGTINGLWTTLPRQGGGFSHGVFYGIERRNDVPEPGTLVLAGLALAGMSMVARRRRPR